jgi:ferrochelatase
MATPVPPVSQDRTGSKGPTAMVFLNMGGPSTTDEVGDFLSRLFVSPMLPYRRITLAPSSLLTFPLYVPRRMVI